MSEYLPQKYKRREFMTDFFGSQGTCLITKTEAHLIVDGRYIIEAKKTAAPEYSVHLLKKGFFADIIEILEKINFKGVVGIDIEVTSWISFKALDNYIDSSSFLKNGSLKIKLLDVNLVDIIREKEIQTTNMIFFQDIKYAGESSMSKVQKVLLEMKKLDARVLFLSSLTQISWLLNLRGSDVHCTPVFTGYVVIEIFDSISNTEKQDISFNIKLFVEVEKIKNCESQLKKDFPNSISIIPIENIMEELYYSFDKAVQNSGGSLHKIWLPEEFCNIAAMMALYKALGPRDCDYINDYKKLIEFFEYSKLLLTSESPVIMLRGIKNQTELEGMRECHIYDGLAVCRFLHYLHKTGKDGTLFEGNVSEWDLSNKLLEYREQQPKFIYPSFDTISSIGGNGAIIHYSPKEEGSSIIKSDMYLCDSGGQYLNGTTDITRTLFLFGRGGERPRNEHVETFTRVLIGFIRLHKSIFPVGTSAVAIDVLARSSLWEAGLDYLHGTGHGVGSFLSVHEEPWSICYKGSRYMSFDRGLGKGAVVSIEPGYYEEGKFGIRIENLAEIVSAEIDNGYNKLCEFLTFSPLTFVPIQKELIDISLLADDELSWLNWYHSKTLEKLEPLINDDPEFLSWLVNACSPIERNKSNLPIPKTLYQ
ncbi:aminopeptidase P2 [Cryptosporidium felis]|nr:aminopeptidase P2 [Cryptosporidium felis]